MNSFEFPELGALTARRRALFNSLYYWRHYTQHGSGLVSPEAFFYPLDAVLEWNRVYGPRGFTQYQCVLRGPRARPRSAS